RHRVRQGLRPVLVLLTMIIIAHTADSSTAFPGLFPYGTHYAGDTSLGENENISETIELGTNPMEDYGIPIGIHYQSYTRAKCGSFSGGFDQSPCKKANDDIVKYTDVTEFETTVMLVATWTRVQHESNAYSGSVTFQAAIVTDGRDTYALFYYPGTGGHWETDITPDISIGYSILSNGNLEYNELVFSNSEAALRIHAVLGNKAWLCCDPHITTLDEKGYVFNGWGEYTMMTLTTSDVTFTLQGRTDRPELGSGRFGNATVFTAFGASENGITVFTGLHPGDKSSFVIYANGTDYSLQFQNTPDFLVDTEDFKLSRNNESLTVSFPSGVTIALSIITKSLAMSLSLPLSFQHQARGFLGNFNGNKDDDFILPDGTVLPRKVTEANTVMRYGPREGPANYDHSDFIPVFLDEQPSSVIQEAEAVCGSTNLACLNDFVATGSREFAQNSKTFTEEAERTNEIAKNAVPQLDVPDGLNLTSGVTVTFVLQGHDEDANDVLTYHAADDENGVVQVNPTTGQVTYTPDDSQPTVLSFFVTDSKDVQSPVFVVPVVVCSNCSDHGVCDFSRSYFDEEGDYNFQFAVCVCEPAWDGPHCERDRDGCAGNPCMVQQTCTDLTPQEQGQQEIGYDCGPCPDGFLKAPGSQECHDINECADNATNECEHNCFNTKGSYQCTCNAGFRLDNDGHACWDIDECQELTHSCEHICINTVGSYTCQCEEGYILGNSSTTCTQDATTASICSNAGCSQGCKSTVDSSTGNRIPQCFCFSGYDLDPTDERTCRDHDECQDNVCTQECFNYEGGFSCFCSLGYKLSADGITCDPCSKLRYGLNCELTCTCRGRFEVCHPVTGCICDDGWTGNLCHDDVDECSENKTICGSDQVCHNTRGSYTCDCLDGYRKNTHGVCEDIDECAPGSMLNTCGPQEECVNVPGTFYCTCGAGYTSINGECADVDECSGGTSNCEQICVNVPGFYNCDCYYGYRLDANRVSCTHVSEVCAQEGLICAHGCTLNNDDQAVCFCRKGFQLASDQQSCDERCDVIIGCKCMTGWRGERCDVDINECDTASAQQQCRDVNALCFNYPGGYDCQCEDGYEKDSGICQDIDECLSNLCDQQCENLPGSYRCLCKKGFTFNSETGLCKDVDECAIHATNNCTQRCLNVAGSYKCTCNMPGHVIDTDGISCIATEDCVRTDCPSENGGCSQEECFCNSGYILSSDGNSCELEDVDWCTVAGCDHHCTETDDGNSFVCSCEPGYLLQEDGTTCDVCRQGSYGEGCVNTCTCDMQNTISCDNVNGSCTCKAGFHGPTCTDDINECTATPGVTCPENSHCINTIGSYLCACENGYFKDTDGSCIRLRRVRVGFTIVGISVSSTDLDDPSSPSYILWARHASEALANSLRKIVRGFTSVNIAALRPGSLIVDADIIIDETSHPDAVQLTALALKTMMYDSLNVGGQTGNISRISVNDAETSNTILIAVLVTFLVVTIVVIVVAGLCIYHKKKKKTLAKTDPYLDQTNRSSTPSVETVRAPHMTDNIAPVSTLFDSGDFGGYAHACPTYEMTEHPYDKLGFPEEQGTRRPQSAFSGYLSLNGWTDGMNLLSAEHGTARTNETLFQNFRAAP
ncbi:hypothetical protein BaRGS_00025180, partial [Batillaria attramentaria]